MSRLYDPAFSSFSEGMMNRPEGGRHRRRASAPVGPEALQLSDYTGVSGGQEGSITYARVVETELHSLSKNRTADLIVMKKTRLRDLSNSLMASKELLEVLNRAQGFRKQQPSTVPLIFAMRDELDRAWFHIEQLVHESTARRSEIELFYTQFAEETAAWEKKERRRLLNAIAHIAEELEMEKTHRRLSEKLNKKLAKEISNMKSSFSEAVKELESERRTKEILEQFCDELAQGIGDDRAEVERLKMELAKVLKEVEKEREMMQLADVLREERVRMKLAEAKYHFEEKNASVEMLKDELESYLKAMALRGEGRSLQIGGRWTNQ
ncbi:hypothetical protein SAY87_013686 [Trapa incisa]|uniref:Uncharacterized protein n=1 Tax=Trapa incisa TaxID=236973 RepID=A0AAN7K939_9MYRT|nr:hypothetical protein SAY87_013686 [Trapa incisa]